MVLMMILMVVITWMMMMMMMMMMMILDECAKTFTTLDLSLLLFIVSSLEE
jgi:hypothetical protein